LKGDDLVRAVRPAGSATVVLHDGDVRTPAGRLLDALGPDAGLVVSVAAPVDAHGVLTAVAGTLAEAALVAGHPAAHPWRALAGPLADARHSWGARFDVLAVHVLPNFPLLLLVENAEWGVDGTGEFRDPTLAGLLAVWAARASRSRLVVVSQVPLRLPGAVFVRC
jgi:hypothetical protein